MKRNIITFLALVCFVSCNKIGKYTEMVPAPDICASIDDSLSEKTSITTDPEGVGTVWWNPADEIAVFFDSESASGIKYVSQNTVNTTSTKFKSEEQISATSTTPLAAIYPYDPAFLNSSSRISVTLPTIQYGVENSFDKKLFYAVSDCQGDIAVFKNVCSGLKFTLSRNDVKEIIFSANGGLTYISGLGYIDKSTANLKIYSTSTYSYSNITLKPKSGETFKQGVVYYIILPVTTLNSGFTMIFETATEIGVLYSTTSQTFTRSKFKKKDNIDSYAQFCGTESYVDMGSGIKWSTKNLGASKIEDSGTYFAWAEVQPKNSYSWETYKYCKGSSNTLTKYNKYSRNGYNGYTDVYGYLTNSDDAATVNVGSQWRMPYLDECKTLRNNSIRRLNHSHNGVIGTLYISTVKNYYGKNLFFPTAGKIEGTTNTSQGKACWYWTRQCANNGIGGPNATAFRADSNYSSDDFDRCYGLPIRPVQPK